MTPCGCGGSQQPRQARPAQAVRPASPAAVPGGPGEDGYTWNGPKRTEPKAETRKRAPVSK
jgi:hypothetical protein